MRFVISSDVFAAFPGMRVVAVLAHDIDNTTDNTEITRDWEGVWDSASAAIEYGNSQSHPRVSPWRVAFQRLGFSGKKFPSSIEALLRRALKGNAPFSINPLVDFYNTVSLRHVVPAGGFDVADLDGHLDLRLTKEGDQFQSLDDRHPAEVPEGEVAYAIGNTVLTRHFVWRQASRGLITSETKSVLLVSEVLGELPDDVVDAVTGELVAGLELLFKVTTYPQKLDSNTNIATW